MGSTTVFVTNKARLIDSSLSCVCPKHLSSLPGGAYLPVPPPHSWHVPCAINGQRSSIHANNGFCRITSQHGLFEVGERVAVGEEVGVAVAGMVGEEVGEAEGAMEGQSLPRLVPSTPL